MDDSRLSAQVALAVSERLTIYPEECLKYVAVLQKFDPLLARNMEQKYKGEPTHSEQKSFSINCMWHSHVTKSMGSDL